MFLIRSKLEIVIRVLLITIVLFNGFAPTAALAKSSTTQSNMFSPSQSKYGENENESTNTNSLRYNNEDQRFVRPTARVNREADFVTPTSMQGSGAALSCFQPIGTYTTCTQVAPNTVRIDFNVLSDNNNDDRGYSVHNSVTTDLYFGFHWDAGGWWYRYGYDANNTSQARGFNVGLNGLGYYYQSGYFAPVAGHGTYRTNAQGNYWIDGPFVGGDFAGRSDPEHPLGVRNWEITISRGWGPSTLQNVTGYSGTGYLLVSTVPLSLDPNSVLFSGSNGSASAFGGFGPTESSCNVSCIDGSQGSGGDPINTNSGVFSAGLSDLSFPTSAGELIFQRSYSSGATSLYNLPLGYGWTHNHDAKLIFPSDPGGSAGFVIFKAVTGNQYKFKTESDGSYSPAHGVIASLTKSSTEYTLVTSDQSAFRFDLTGRLISRANAQGHAFTYYPDPQGRLGKVSADEGNRFIQIHYDPQGRIDLVTDHTGRHVSYGYNPAGDLVSFVDVLERTWTYTYEAHRMTKIQDQNLAQTLKTEYDPQGRAYRQWDGLDKKLVELTYNADGTTTIADVLGKTQTHTYNGRNTLTKDSNQMGGTIIKTYDPNFRPSTITSPLQDPARPTTLDWSANGANLEYIKDALDGETFIEYEEANAPTSPTQIIDPFNNKTKYIYENIDFPTLPTRIEYRDSAGILVSSTDYEYYTPSDGTSAGKVELVTEALTHKTHYTYTSFGQTDTVTVAYDTSKAQTTDYDYDDLGRLVKITDPADVVTVNEYDDAGRMTRTIRNVYQPAIFDPEDFIQNLESGENIYNIVTRYRYDARGNQIAVIDTNWMIVRTYYDLANRPVGVVQNLVVNTPADTEEEVTTAINTSFGSVQYSSSNPDRNIRTETKYADNGDVIATIDSAGVITRTYYDYAERTQTVVQNLTGRNITDPEPLGYDPAYPDQNIHTKTIFDVNGNVIATIDNDEIITRTYYDELNRPEIIVQNLTGAITNPPLNRTNPPDPEYNLHTNMYYDANGNLIATRDPRGVVTRTYYDALNRPMMVVQNWDGSNVYTDPAPDRSQCGSEINVCTETYYNEVGNVYLTIDARGVPTSTDYDEANRPELIVQNPGGLPNDVLQTEITYDENGRRDTTTDSLDHVTKYDYNDMGQLIQTTVNYLDNNSTPSYLDKFNIITKYTYDALGRQLTQEDALGRVTLNGYDELGRLSEVTQNYLNGSGPNHKDSSGDQYNIITRYSYDSQGNQIAQSSIKDLTTDIVTRTYYDALGRPLTVVRNSTSYIRLERSDPPDPFANLRTDTIYLGNGNVDYVKDEMGKITDYSYDDVGRLITILDPLSNPTNFAYDASGNRTLITTFVNDTTETEAVSTKYEYDDLNRLKIVIENYRLGVDHDAETNVTTTYTYDASGNRLSIRDGNSNLLPNELAYWTTFTYDALGRVKSESDPLGHESTYTYSQDAIGNLVSVRDAMLQTTVQYYDELNRLYLIDYPAPDADVTFTYDVAGRRKTMTDGLGTTNWTYNNLDLPNSIAAPLSPEVSYGYDEMGNRANLAYDDKEYVYEYDELNRLREVTGSGLPDKVEYDYYASGNLKAVTRPNGVDTAYNYFENGWLKDITHSSTTTLASYEYEYYMNGNRKKAIENVLLPILPPSPTPTSTVTSIVTNTNTATPSHTPTQTFTPTATQVVDTNTPTITPTLEVTPTHTLTATPTGVSSPTETATVTAAPSPTGTMSQTQTPTNTPQAPTGALYLSLDGSGTVGGVAAQDIDILYYNGTSWSLFFDASDVGISTSGQDINDFHILDADTILMIFNDPFTLGGLSVDTWDIVQFNATSLGETTSGTFSLYFDGEDVGLDDTANENLDALEILSDGRILVSTDGNFTVSGVTGKDEDLLALTPTTLGGTTSGTWTMYFDGSITGIDLSNGEDVDAVEVASNGDIYLSASDVFAVTGLSGEDEDVFVCTPTFAGGSVTSCTYTSTLYFDGSTYGLGTHDVDGINLTLGGMVFNNSSSIALGGSFKPVVYRESALQQSGPYSSQPGSADGVDTYILSTSPTTNNGTDVALGVGENNNATNRYARSLIKFDLSSIPANALITSATLSLWTTTDLSDNESTISVYRLLKAFDEAQTTWTLASTGENWETAGASGATDREGTAIGSILISASEALNTEKQISLSTAQIQALVNGTFINKGFIIANTDDNNRFNYKSSDASNVSQRPKLVIQYTIPPTATPTSTPVATATQTPVSPTTTEVSVTPSLTPTFTPTPTGTSVPAGPLTIDYTYDPLNRLSGAIYSDGKSFAYEYDAVGNVFEYTQIQSGIALTTTYDYDIANQLKTAQVDNSPILWQYNYDPNGRLTEVLPDGNPANGAKRYTYNTAGYLMQTEAYESGSYQPQAEMLYDGLGQRLSMTGYALETSVTTNYVLDPMQNSRPLSATSNGNTTLYLYGVDPIAELTTSWSYSLADGTNTPRQFTNDIGEITLSGRYTPWGNSLDYAGTGNFTFGYFGGLMDSATGLLYIGSGQYYDPATGRFSTRDIQFNKTNPYVPSGNPIGALLAPLALVGLIYPRKRKKTGFDHFVIMLFVAVAAGMSLSACAPGNPSTPPNPPTLPGPIVTVIHQPTSTSTSTSTPPPLQVYDPNVAVNYAVEHMVAPLPIEQADEEGNCANLISYSLGIAGILDPSQNWAPGSPSWIRSGSSASTNDDLFDFLSQYFVTSDVYKENVDMYTGFELRGNEGFEQWINKYHGRIRKGDLIFVRQFDKENNIAPDHWTHAALITNPSSSQTTIFNKTVSNTNMPKVVERGKLSDNCQEYLNTGLTLPSYCTNSDPGRSIDDTTASMSAVAIVFMQEPKIR